jgi:hypothetical protein
MRIPTSRCGKAGPAFQRRLGRANNAEELAKVKIEKNYTDYYKDYNVQRLLNALFLTPPCKFSTAHLSARVRTAPGPWLADGAS